LHTVEVLRNVGLDSTFLSEKWLRIDEEVVYMRTVMCNDILKLLGRFLYKFRHNFLPVDMV